MMVSKDVVVGLVAIAVLSSAVPAEARGGHGFGGHFGSHGLGHHFGGHGMAGGEAFASDHRHGNDDYVKAAADEEDKLLNSKIKSICRGC
jgi:hypothetical protein